MEQNNTTLVNEPEKFDVKTVAFSGKNLIEASAGTGKTFSLALMALRLIIEQGMLPNQILMVTFTEKATAELQERVRKYIREAYQYLFHQVVPPTKIIKEIIDNNVEDSKMCLKEAMTRLDELQIFTIHNFCNRTLNSYAFETQIDFSTKLKTDFTAYKVKAVMEKWFRERLYNNENIEQYIALYNHILNISKTNEFLTNLTLGKELIAFEELDDEIINKIIKNKKFTEDYKIILQEIYALFKDAAMDLKQYFKEYVQSEKVMSQDDLILRLHEVKDNVSLINALATQYYAVFIDEFQDTDCFQYEIFTTLFPSQTLFLIGDPKQAIYGFRGGDIFTYFRAKEDKSLNVYTLDTNYRTDKALVDKVNKIFEEPEKEKSSFYFDLDDTLIEFGPAEAHHNNCEFKYGNQELDTRCFINENLNIKDIAGNISQLLSKGTIKGKTIQPHQIAVLAKTNDELKSMQNELTKLNIPSLMLYDEKIFKTEACQLIKLLLQAITTRKVNYIIQILNHPLFDIPLKDIQNGDYSDYIQLFYKLFELGNDKGVYDVLMKSFEDLSIQHYIQQQKLENGIKFWAHLNQIAEQLQELQTLHQLSLIELTDKLLQEDFNHDEYLTRVEMDKNAVQLLTIHKSKGLEFEIVFLIDITKGLGSTKVEGIYTYYDKNKKQYLQNLSIKNYGYYDKLYLDQYIQEHRRLCYVALTRAKHLLFVNIKNKKNKYSIFQNINLSINPFEHAESGNEQCSTIYKSSTTLTPIQKQATFQVCDKDYKKMSFSSLSGIHQSFKAIDKEMDHSNAPYEQFILQDLTKGTTTGNLIHSLFENIDFTESDNWNAIIQKYIRIFVPTKLEVYRDALPIFLQQVLNTNILVNNTQFKLSTISNDKKSMS